MTQEKNYYPFLDTLRGVAILWVLLLHINQFFDLEMWLGRYFIWFYKIASVGYLGVHMFFVISGFLITGVLIRGFDQEIRVKRFYSRRCFKILPQYYLVLLVGILLTFGPPHFDVEPPAHDDRQTVLWNYFFFIQNFFEQIPVLAHTWSLAVEEHFYLFYPLLLLCIFRWVKNAEDRRKWLIGIFLILIVSTNVFRMVWVPAVGSRYIPFQTTFYCIDALIFGCLLKFWEPHIIKDTGQRPSPSSIGLLCVGLMIYQYLIITGAKYFLWETYTLAYLAPGAILVAGLKGLDRFLDHRILHWIGKNSYGIYLWHYILAFPVVTICRPYPVWRGVTIYLSLSILIGWVSTVTVERYFLNLRSRIAP